MESDQRNQFLKTIIVIDLLHGKVKITKHPENNKIGRLYRITQIDANKLRLICTDGKVFNLDIIINSNENSQIIYELIDSKGIIISKENIKKLI